jgi:four helix bundle protein
MSIASFRDLRVWQLGMDLVQQVYSITRVFPAHERYGLASQMQRAAVSIPSNIAEGHARQHRREYVQHLSIAQASLAELDTQLEIAVRLDYLQGEDCLGTREAIDSPGRQLRSLRTSLLK